MIKPALALVASCVLMLAARAPSAIATAERATSPRSVWDSVYTAAQAGRGDTIYSQLCAQCHGETLAGIDDARPLAGRDFMQGWEGLTVGTLFGKIQRTMPQSSSVVLTPQQIADVVAYILRYNRFPAGKIDLASDKAVLDAIRIESARPRSDSGGIHDLTRGNR